MQYDSFNINMVYFICMCYKLQSICNDPILLICYIHGAYLLSLFFQKYYTLVSNQNATMFHTKTHQKNQQHGGYIQHEGTNPKQTKNKKKPDKTHTALISNKTETNPNLHHLYSSKRTLFSSYTYIFTSHVQYWGPSAETTTQAPSSSTQASSKI